MSTQTLISEWLGAWSAGDAEKLLSFYRPAAYYQDPSCPQGLRGHEQMRPYFTKLLKAYPGWRWAQDQLFTGDQGLTLRWSVSWAEPWRQAIQGLDWITLRDGRIDRNEVYFDASAWPQRAYRWTRENCEVSTDKQRLDRDKLLALLRDTYWASAVTPPLLAQRIDSSLCFGLYADGAMIGFARALTDHHTFAYLADVIVDSAWRGKGLGTWMVDCALKHPKLQPMRRWLLKTRDAHGVYHKLGFHPLLEPDGYLELLAGDPRS